MRVGFASPRGAADFTPGAREDTYRLSPAGGEDSPCQQLLALRRWLGPGRLSLTRLQYTTFLAPRKSGRA